MAATAAATGDLHLGSNDTLVWYRSAPTTEYGFCRQCGSTLFWRADDRPDQVSITAGTVDPPTGLRTVTALFMAEHGDYHTPEPDVDEWPADQT